MCVLFILGIELSRGRFVYSLDLGYGRDICIYGGKFCNGAN